MYQQQAFKLLGVEQGASQKAIINAHRSKQQSLIEKLSAAPTDALKAKLQQMNQSLDEALALLTSPSPSGEEEQSTAAKSKRSPLTESKLFDIPGVAAADVEKLDLQAGQCWLAVTPLKSRLVPVGWEQSIALWTVIPSSGLP